MAEAPESRLRFFDPPLSGFREADLPDPLPELGDDIDWLVRDYDGFRMFMMEELAARFPERTRWTPADIEVVLVEALAAVLDQFSDMADRLSAEAYLATARRPESVRRLLGLIGYDAVAYADKSAGVSKNTGAQGETAGQRNIRLQAQYSALEHYWAAHPHIMERQRSEGSRRILQQQRMVTAQDYAVRLEEHPLVLRANAYETWSGSWHTVRVGVIVWDQRSLDKHPLFNPEEEKLKEQLTSQLAGFYADQGMPADLLDIGTNPIRSYLQYFIQQHRMAAQEVVLEDAVPVGVDMRIHVRVAGNFYQSEVRHAVSTSLGRRPGGFFEPGRLQFGEDLHLSDIYQTLMCLDGVEWVKINYFGRVSQGGQSGDASLIRLDGLEIAVCDNNPLQPERGRFWLSFEGGRRG